jgi:hypothetical protein
MWQQMHEQGYGPGMMMQQMPSEQPQPMWQQMREQGYGPGMMMQQMPSEQPQPMWEPMRQQGYAPGMMLPGAEVPGFVPPAPAVPAQ